MRLRLWHRLFVAFVVLCGATLAGFVVWQQWRFREGFANYLNAVSLQRLQGASERLADAYRDHGDWGFLRGDDRAFEQLIEPFGRHHGPRGFGGPPPPGDDREPPDRGPPPGMRGGPPPAHPDRDPSWPPEGFGGHGPPPGAPPPAWELRNRVLLTDANDAPVVGDERAAVTSTHLAVEVDGKRVGTLHLRPPPRLLGGLDQAFTSAQWHDALIAGGVVMIVALLFAFALARWLLAPVRALASGMHALGSGDFAQRIEPASSDELGALARDFNHLAQTLEQHRDARRRWGADIAHELRTPLAVLRGEVSALQDGVRSATPAAFDSLQAECTRLSSLIEDLYQLALADAGALEYRFETLDLGALAREAVELQRRLCADAGLTLEILAPDEVLPVRADARRLTQLFDNLLSNARRYTDAPGRIRLAIAHGSNVLRLTVDDSAPGVPDSALPHLFERLYRVEESRSRSAGGAGLGLAICRAIVEAHGGSITAAPSRLGGLQIAVELPMTAGTPA
jgi:two-component system sensor histidine kinase BaeS